MVTTRLPKTIVKPTALGPVANTDSKLLIYGLFQKGRVLAQDGVENQFILSFERRVSKDNIISYEATPFELPQGYAGQRLIIFRNLLTSDVSIIHDGRRVILQPVDPVRNAYAKRGARSIDSPQPSPPVPTTAAEMAFDSAFKPLVDDEGNFPDSKEPDHEK